MSDKTKSPVGGSNSTPRRLYSFSEVSRRLNLPHERATVFLKNGTLQPDYFSGQTFLFHENRIGGLKSAIDKAQANPTAAVGATTKHTPRRLCSLSEISRRFNVPYQRVVDLLKSGTLQAHFLAGGGQSLFDPGRIAELQAVFRPNLRSQTLFQDSDLPIIASTGQGEE
jgi:hypothetical protein